MNQRNRQTRLETFRSRPPNSILRIESLAHQVLTSKPHASQADIPIISISTFYTNWVSLSLGYWASYFMFPLLLLKKSSEAAASLSCLAGGIVGSTSFNLQSSLPWVVFPHLETFSNIWRDVWLSQLRDATGIYCIELRVAINHPTCAEQPWQQIMMLPKISIMPWLRNYALEPGHYLSMALKKWYKF